MPDKPRSWDLEAPTPTSQPLDSEEIHTGSPLGESITHLGVRRRNLEAEILTFQQLATLWVELPILMIFQASMLPLR